tara:strand:+ start:371 stop:523 length:153 start_codon:yes stop_codon:yes gene_type:complete
MLIFNIAEWIANIFILGLGAVLWVIAIFGITIIFSVINKSIKEIIKKEII